MEECWFMRNHAWNVNFPMLETDFARLNRHAIPTCIFVPFRIQNTRGRFSPSHAKLQTHVLALFCSDYECLYSQSNTMLYLATHDYSQSNMLS
jgi:hypothetical protein